MNTTLASIVATLLSLAAGCASDGPKYHDVPVDQAPRAIQAFVDDRYPGAKVDAVKKEIRLDGKTRYRVEFSTPQGKSHTATFEDVR